MLGTAVLLALAFALLLPATGEESTIAVAAPHHWPDWPISGWQAHSLNPPINSRFRLTSYGWVVIAHCIDTGIQPPLDLTCDWIPGQGHFWCGDGVQRLVPDEYTPPPPPPPATNTPAPTPTETPTATPTPGPAVCQSAQYSLDDPAPGKVTLRGTGPVAPWRLIRVIDGFELRQGGVEREPAVLVFCLPGSSNPECLNPSPSGVLEYETDYQLQYQNEAGIWGSAGCIFQISRPSQPPAPSRPTPTRPITGGFVGSTSLDTDQNPKPVSPIATMGIALLVELPFALGIYVYLGRRSRKK